MTRAPHMDLPDAVASVAAALDAAGHAAVLVGGAVRDALRGLAPCDFDVATDADIAEMREALRAADGVRSVYALGERWGTVGAALDDGTTLELTTFRAPGTDAATRFAADAALRDFTVNALGIDLRGGELLDPLGGAADLEAGVLRAPGSPAERFSEDPLRVLRAARFVSQLGFSLEARTAAALPDAAPLLARVAVERVRDELTKLLVGGRPDEGLRVLAACGALDVVLPEVAALDGVTQPSFHDLDVLGHTFQAVAATPAAPMLRWAALLHDVGKEPVQSVEPDGRIRFFGHAHAGAELADAICRRLKFSNAERAIVTHLVAEHMRLGDLDTENPRAVDRAVRRLDLWAGAGDGAKRIATAEDALELAIADLAATAHRDEAPAAREELAAAIAESRARRSAVPLASPVSGAELMAALGLAGGPAVGAAKEAILSAIEDGDLAPDDRDGALRVAREAVRGTNRA